MVSREDLRRGRAQQSALRRLGLRTPVAHEDDLAAIEEAAGIAAVRPELAAELQRLSSDQRDALQLRVIEEMPYDEVAGRLDCSRRTVARKLETIRLIWSNEPAP